MTRRRSGRTRTNAAWTTCWPCRSRSPGPSRAAVEIKLARRPVRTAHPLGLRERELYLRGRFHVGSPNGDSKRKALEYFEAVVAAAPRSALGRSTCSSEASATAPVECIGSGWIPDSTVSGRIPALETCCGGWAIHSPGRDHPTRRGPAVEARPCPRARKLPVADAEGPLRTLRRSAALAKERKRGISHRWGNPPTGPVRSRGESAPRPLTSRGHSARYGIEPSGLASAPSAAPEPR
jgi:hypothetical protein